MADRPLPEDVIAEAVRLTRLAHRATEASTDRHDEATQYRHRRDALLADHDYTARLRTEDGDPTVVLYPDDWVTDGTVDLTAIEDTDTAIERPLRGGGPQDYDTAATRNQAVVETVATQHDAVHAANAAAFAAFMNNHRAQPIATATGDDIQEFLTEYYPRNVWPTAEQAATVCRSLRIALATATRN